MCIKMVVTYFLSVFDPGPYYSIALCARVPTLCSGQIIRHLLNMKLCKVTCISHPLGIPLKQLYFATSVWHAYIFQNEFLFYDFMPYYFLISFLPQCKMIIDVSSQNVYLVFPQVCLSTNFKHDYIKKFQTYYISEIVRRYYDKINPNHVFLLLARVQNRNNPLH